MEKKDDWLEGDATQSWHDPLMNFPFIGLVEQQLAERYEQYLRDEQAGAKHAYSEYRHGICHPKGGSCGQAGKTVCNHYHISCMYSGLTSTPAAKKSCNFIMRRFTLEPRVVIRFPS